MLSQPDLEQTLGSAERVRRLVISATFTADPVVESLEFWMVELGLGASIALAPYDQVFQQLLDPGSLLAQNQNGVNFVLVRFDDWVRSRSGGAGDSDLEASLERNAEDLIQAVRAATARSSAPMVLGICPDSVASRNDARLNSLFARLDAKVTSELGDVPGLYLLKPEDLKRYPVADYDDPQRDYLGHIPYTPVFFSALGTALARKTYALLNPPHKVVVLDCDNTLWKGVVGEEGVDGIEVTPASARLQRFMVELTRKGFLLCLCSKNDEPDVLAVLDQRSDMVLKREHLTSWRINWGPKSENIRSLAHELNVGIDSFIFLDDNPVECAEVQSGCPEVLTLQLPADGELDRILEHVWAFDRLRVTAEDQQRTSMYKGEVERARFQKEAPTIAEFLAGLDLRIQISEPGPEHVARLAQLTQRTNQFNFTTIRRNEGEIQRLKECGLESRIVYVSDRFGDYGLVGAMIFGVKGDVLEVDTFLLSCRVLGRGVEHRMLSELGAFAQDRRLARVDAVLSPTKKNQPARDFLDQVAAAYRRSLDGTFRYELPTAVAASIVYSPHNYHTKSTNGEAAPTGSVASAAASVSAGQAPSRIQQIVDRLRRPDQVLEALQLKGTSQQRGPGRDRPVISPRNELESTLAEIWTGLLRRDGLSIDDNFFELGGTSLMAVDLFTQVESRFGKWLPLTSLLEAPTIAGLARLVMGQVVGSTTLVLREGGDEPALFLVHDGHGETLLYANLASRLEPGRAVYGLQPCSRPDVPIVHTRVPEMAAFHIEQIRRVQPHGPYLLGGLCFGGVIAFEMARQLAQDGEEVALVALLDSADSVARLKAWRATGQRLKRFSSVVHDDGPSRRRPPIGSILSNALRKIRNTSNYLVTHNLERMRQKIRIRRFRACINSDRDLPESLKNISARTMLQFAVEAYRPEGPFDGQLVLFRATEGSGNDEPFIDRYEDPNFGWGPRARRGLRVFDTPGGHSSMLQEPGVDVLAEQMQSLLDDVLAPDQSRPRMPAMAQG